MNPFKALFEILATNCKYRKQTVAMAKSTLKKHYSGALFGWAWSVVRPVVFIYVYWFGISVGIRGNKPIIGAQGQEIPFILWMIPGVIAWFAFQETLSAGVSCVRSESHLVTKMVFPISTIPVFSVMSYFVSHLMMILISVGTFLVTGYPLTVYFVQILFYLPLFFIFCCITATFVSTLGVISRDFEQLIKAIMNIFFWMTPILYQGSKLKGAAAFIIKLNPFNYFVQGYRETFLGEVWFFEHPVYTAYTLVFMLVFALITAALHKKLAPEFADVL